ncbi:MAG: TIGR02996 domain-containing protein [Gemmataceae bacterium]|nr:TIGR02996 domain-containing protein [Gemmataceae bacterium]
MDPTELALLAGVVADPFADTTRLIYADWLDENGRPERAEFIRVQVELARMEAEEEAGGLPTEIDPHEGHTCCDDPCPICPNVDRYAALRNRSEELFMGYARELAGLPPLPG